MIHKILIVEDDLGLGQGIKLALSSDRLMLEHVTNLSDAENKIKVQSYDLIILDINLPDGNGLEYLAASRQEMTGKVILLTANDMETDIVSGLELGADDYITKPFSLMVLRARVNAQLRQKPATTSSDLAASAQWIIDDFDFDFDRMVYKKSGVIVELSKTEQRLLRLLLENKGQKLMRETLIRKIWSEDLDYVDENALSVSIKRLRDKLEDNPSKPQYIITIYGIGYMWVQNHV